MTQAPKFRVIDLMVTGMTLWLVLMLFFLLFLNGFHPGAGWNAAAGGAPAPGANHEAPSLVDAFQSSGLAAGLVSDLIVLGLAMGIVCVCLTPVRQAFLRLNRGLALTEG